MQSDKHTDTIFMHIDIDGLGEGLFYSFVATRQLHILIQKCKS